MSRGGSRTSHVDGLVVVDKPPGWTSHDVVGKLRRVYGQRRVGHAGTLDPDATGVLLVGLGRATRLLRYLQETTKAYAGTVSFGTATSTLDAAGDVVATAEMHFDRAALDAACRAFIGEIDQVPPMVSAIKVDGKRLHERARAGEEVERAPRRVRIDRIDVEAFDAERLLAKIVVECGSGTYIRSLAADLGETLGGYAHLASLRRTRVGAFTLDDARSLEVIEADAAARVVTPAGALRGMSCIEATAEQCGLINNGARFAPADLLCESVRHEDGPWAVVDSDGALVAVYERKGTIIKPTVVMTG